MAHVGRETGVTIDALFEGRGHAVERRGEHLEVAVVGGVETGVETTAGDGLGRLGRVGQGFTARRATHVAEQHAEGGGDGGRADQGEPDASQRGRDLGQRLDLEVARLARGDRNAHGEHRLTAQVVHHAGRRVLVSHPVDERGR